jgi:DNA-binding NarL/FixJ family response regulator
MPAEFGFNQRAAHDAGADRCTEREFLVLCLIAEGFTNAEIACRLYISRQSVALHVTQLLRTLGARSRAELVARAYCDGILPLGIWPPVLLPPRLSLVTAGPA